MAEKKKAAPKKVAKKKAIVEKEEIVNPMLAAKSVIVCKDENGQGGTEVLGIISGDGKSVTTLEGVTYTI